MRSIVVSLLVALLLSACAGGGPKKRVFPPEARIHELQIDDRDWRLQLRLHNFSTVPMRFSRVDATLTLDGQHAAAIALEQSIDVAANSVELLSVDLTPSADARRIVAQALAGSRGIEYRLVGRIVSAEPRGHHPFEFASRLDRVPGLEHVLR